MSELRHVWVTGASSGIGHATALAFAARGAALTLTARRADELAALAAAIGARGGRATVAVADVADRTQVEAAAAQAAGAFGPIDALICSAGVMYTGPIHKTDPERFARMMAVNYLGTVHAVQAVLPAMLQRAAGHIVAISSLAGRLATRGYGGYAPTKFAVLAFTRSLRLEVAPRGVHVACLLPGPVDTPMIRDRQDQGPADTIPLLPLPGPAAVAAAAVSAVLRRRREVYVPGSLRLLTALHTLFPAAVEWLSTRLPLRQNNLD